MVANKKCNICNKIKPLEDFHISKANKKNGRYSYCRECKRNKYLSNREPALKRAKKWREDNNEFYIQDQKRRYLENREDRMAVNAKYYLEHKAQLNEWAKGYMIEKRKNNKAFKIQTILQSRLTGFIISRGNSKDCEKLFGCDLETLKKYIESKFKEGMNWDNRGKTKGTWQIDHIRPYSKFDLTKEEEILKCCHYTNLQPLWQLENIRKGKK